MSESLFNNAVSYLNRTKIPGLKDEQQLYFYGHFKQATQGKCNTKQPSFFDFVGKAKWSSWSNLGDMSKEDAMNNYIKKLDELQPNWRESINDTATTTTASTTTTTTNTSNTTKTKSSDQSLSDDDDEEANKNESLFESSEDESSSKRGGAMGPIMSRFNIASEENMVSKTHDKEDIVYWSSCDNLNKVEELLKVSSGKCINDRDSEQKTALIWCCDRGNLEITELLLSGEYHVDIDCQDDQGMTALHYAAMGGFDDIVALLLKHHASTDIKDNNQETAQQLVDPMEHHLIDLFNKSKIQ
ncbi:ankyrin repeat-containing protein [Heterostelium album PN500]|uniref:Ankyrin repeat-containing protein n=1 Tax=Heterostelium pallidum (strain ATCC 26659 / Pp 5 / PN500) TaxID=670386 RepID=D3BF67_HETP5|nr:ankyrin repeat-containing protein [Heterostelium album PN500]EFA79781.1 ankyrin repeat-containing protein [Heterostelium album PN500]|eukprot:XP_020431902.1 ankyrin repeat-containing protein [Heterostelium album PN500]